MVHTEKVSIGPVVKDNEGVVTNGYHYSMYEKWEGETEEEFQGIIKSDAEGWDLFSDGSFIYYKNSDTEECLVFCNGKFNSSKYDEIVEQIKELKIDWLCELEYDEETLDATIG